MKSSRCLGSRRKARIARGRFLSAQISFTHRIAVRAAIYMFFLFPVWCGAESAIEPSRLLDILKAADHDALHQLLNSGLDVETRLPLGNGSESLIVAACIFGDSVMITDLIGHGAHATDYSLTGWLGESPVAIAMNRSKPDIIELLIQHGADSAGFTPLMIAIMRGDLSAAERELAKGADVNAENKFGRTALDFAHPIAECLQLLLNHGARHSYSPTEIATMLGDEMSIRRELDSARHTKDWSDEVHWAILYDRPTILQSIVTAIPNAASDESGSITPAALAVKMGRVECLRVLLRAHADLQRRSGGNLTPMDLARQREDSACLRLLTAQQRNHGP